MSGASPRGLIEKNLKDWNGDRLVYPSLVPGILFCDRRITVCNPTLYGLAPTVLRFMGFDDDIRRPRISMADRCGDQTRQPP